MNKAICTFEQKILIAATAENPKETTKFTAPVSFTSVKLRNNIKANIFFLVLQS
jgi:hypothetical protein